MTSYTNISRWLKSSEYRSQLDSVLTKIVRDCDHSDSEEKHSRRYGTRKYCTIFSYQADNKRIIQDTSRYALKQGIILC